MDKWLQNTNVVKIIALAIGILLWVVVHLDIKTGTDTTIPTTRDTTISNVMVQPVYDETQYSIVSIEPKEVTVVLKGKSSAIAKVTPSNLQIKVDLTKKTAGTFYLPVGPDAPLPSGVTAEVTPAQVKVVMEEKQMKEVPIIIDVTGTPAEGFKIGQPISTPNRAYVTVPASLIDRVDSAHGVVNVEKARDSIDKKIKLVAYDRYGKEVAGTINPPVVEVNVPITQPFKAMPLQIRWAGEPASGFAVEGIQQSVDQITVYGPQATLDKMDFFEGGEVNVSGLSQSKTFTVPLVSKNKQLEFDPPEVEVTILVAPAVSKTFDNIPVILGGESADRTAKIVTPENGLLSITVQGTDAVINKLRPQDIQAIANIGNLPPGVHDVPVIISLPPFVKYTDATFTVTVEVTDNTSKVQGTSAPKQSIPAEQTTGPEPTASSGAGSESAGNIEQTP